LAHASGNLEVEPTSDDFGEFFGRGYIRLGRACLLLTGSPAEAEDLAQEALARLCARWELGSLRCRHDSGAAACRCDQALMSVCPFDPVAHAHRALDDFENFTLTGEGADLS